ncbi:universal stress protein [Halobium salinum]|uniref:Universal stress protein n=1 Tax=Halobium salinum TaxID=1364940 RepID=A0ABD5PAS9_9EURY|nr:universal stress protein [Halobium salinum]
MYTRILIPIDGSDEAKQAARQGLALARLFDASVDVLHVVERKALRLTQTANEKRRLRERGQSALEEIQQLASEFGHPVRTELREGSPASQISEFAAEQRAELVVMGRQGLSGARRRLLGGVTEQVLHRSDVPVFVVPNGAQGVEPSTDYTRLLIPTDGSENAEVATRHGTAIAQQCGSLVHVLNVVDLQAAGGVFSAGGLEREFVDRLEAIGEEAAGRVETEIRETAPDVDVETAVTRTTSFDGVAPGIREYVTENEIDLVVMGSHGRSNLGRQLIGSVATTVLRTVDVPVLVVKRPS